MSHPIYPHGDLVELAPNLWQVTGTLKLPVPRNMTVVRTTGGQLVLYSAIALNEQGMRALEALGEPAWLVIPHRRHQLDAPFYRQRYQRLRILAPAPERARGVGVDGALDELTTHDIRAYVLPGNDHEDVIMDVPAGSRHRALCVCETITNVEAHGAWRLLFRLLGPPGGGFGIARAVRLREVRGTPQLREWLLDQADRRDLRALLLGHGAPVVANVPEALHRAAAQL
jgi:hypothetical protein